MGYSCTKDADDTLEVIGRMFATDGNPNILTIRGSQYFFERGRENADGAITGALYEMLPSDLCRAVGRVRINPNGRIDHFPRLRRVEKKEIENDRRDMQARNPELLHAWVLGRV